MLATIRTRAPLPVAGSFHIGSDTRTSLSNVVFRLVGEVRLSLDNLVERWMVRWGGHGAPSVGSGAL